MREGLWDNFVSPDREVAPRVIMSYGCKSFVPETTCQDIHPGGPIPSGSHVVCASCHKSGVDYLKFKGLPPDARPDEKYIKEYGLDIKPTTYTPAKQETGKRPKQLKQARRSK